MKLSEVQNHLNNMSSVKFSLPNGTFVPAHAHITEVGSVTKNFIDCGGVIRKEELISFQLWEEQEDDHRLTPEKVSKIINLSIEKLSLGDHQVEVEYQSSTIGKFGLEFNGENFVLTNKATACLASDTCGVPKDALSQVDASTEECCSPGGGCC